MAEESKVTISTEGLGDEILRGVHAAKSYVGPAFLTLLLYYVGFFIAGLVCNCIFLSKAGETRRIVGRNPSGQGCLVFLLWTHFIIPIVVFVILVSVGAFSAT